MKRLFVALFAIVFMYSCVFTRMDDSNDLGSKYRYIQDYPQVILYHKTPKYRGGGINIVPPIVLSYKFNERFIVAKTQEVDEMTGSKEGKPIHYWIVDKTTNGAAIEPMDSITFYRRLLELDIKMVLH
jgi:hypothetical protein